MRTHLRSSASSISGTGAQPSSPGPEGAPAASETGANQEQTSFADFDPLALSTAIRFLDGPSLASAWRTSRPLRDVVRAHPEVPGRASLAWAAVARCTSVEALFALLAQPTFRESLPTESVPAAPGPTSTVFSVHDGSNHPSRDYAGVIRLPAETGQSEGELAIQAMQTRTYGSERLTLTLGLASSRLERRDERPGGPLNVNDVAAVLERPATREAMPAYIQELAQLSIVVRRVAEADLNTSHAPLEIMKAALLPSTISATIAAAERRVASADRRGPPYLLQPAAPELAPSLEYLRGLLRSLLLEATALTPHEAP